jgi:uncharacterized membrane protein
MSAKGFQQAAETVQGRCSMCHAKEPVWEGIIVPPKGVVLEEDVDIAKYAREIYIQAGRSHAMPPGNLSNITAEERQVLVKWYEGAVSSK